MDEPDIIYIARGAKQPSIEGQLGGLSEALADALGAGGTVASDLTLGAWRPHQVAREFSAQLGIPLDIANIASPRRAAENRERIAGWIDSEARGDAALVGGLELATLIARALARRDRPVHLVLLAPRFGGIWGAENVAFLRFLSHALPRIGARLTIVATGERPTGAEGLPIAWTGSPDRVPTPAARPCTVAGTPGIVEPSLLHAVGAQLDDAIALPGGRVLVRPEDRWHPAGLSAETLALLERCGDEWLTAYARALLCAQDGHVLPLLAPAWRALGEGSGDLALSLLKHASGAAQQPQVAGRVQSALQTVRLVLQRYEEMAEAPVPGVPGEAVPEPEARWQAQMHAWGSIMSGRTEGVQAAMQATFKKGAFSDDPILDLYMRNIEALVLFRSGEPDAAMVAEAEVERRIDAQDRPLWHLRYLNSINTARLHRAAGRNGDAHRYYARAFAITDGVRIPHETFYTALCRADLHGRTDRSRAAFDALLQAVLHWLADPAPETLGWRAAIAAVGRRAGRIDAEAVAAALDARLYAAADAAGIAKEPAVPITILHAELARHSNVDCRTAIGSDGWGVLVSSTAMPPVNAAPNRRALAARVAGILRTLAPNGPWADMRTIVVDDIGGRHLPCTLDEGVMLAVRHGTDRLVWKGTDVTLGAGDREAALMAAKPALGPGLSQITGGTAYFKRFLRPLSLSPVEQTALQTVEHSTSVGDLLRRSDAHPRLALAMFEQRLLALHCTGAARAAVGLSPGEP